LKSEKSSSGRPIAIGISMGLALGAALGTAMGNIAVGIGIGMALGVAIGIAIGSAFTRNHKNGFRIRTLRAACTPQFTDILESLLENRRSGNRHDYND
jgi:ABC-type transport system involved in cytochrome bd biosynthesis fused ATPase/permease subunit